ncbi:Fur family transcriptional regulator [Mucisphaera sp.]|uniref:Fur family transcriptional regulator n=1 Tax=Mucisphaera sp. TaxID=2913024 RepID=UPI003D0D5556
MSDGKRERSSGVSAGGGRRTQQRDTIRRVLEDAARPMAVQEILDAAAEEVPNLGQATVYRAIHHFEDLGVLSPIDLPGEPTRYEWKRSDAHAHFKCESCSRTYCVDAERIELSAKLPDGFRLASHELFLHGLCPECSGSA